MVLLRLLSIATLALFLHSSITGATEVDHPTGQKDFAAHPTQIVGDREDDSSILKHLQTFQERLLSGEQKFGESAIEELFFAISISFSIAEDDRDTCNEAEQMLMGRDINFLLLDYGIGDLGDDADPSYLAGICPMPQPSDHSAVSSLIPEEFTPLLDGRNGYIWRGGGLCRGCSDDNADDARPPDTDGPVDEIRPPGTRTDGPGSLATTLGYALKDLLVPNHPSCLSNTTTFEVTFTEVSSSEIEVYCGKDQLPVLDTIGHMTWEEWPNPGTGVGSEKCGLCHKLDFSTMADGKTKFKRDAFLKKREYRKDSQYGVRIFTHPNDQDKKKKKKKKKKKEKVRIFDTAGPGVVSYPWLGSPNGQCGGDGVGPGGEPKQPGRNCQAMGNVLIIQEPTMSDPHPSEDGGTFMFSFKEPVFISDIGVMDIATTGQTIKFIVKGKGNTRTYGFEGMGENSVQRILVSKHNVKRVEVRLTGPGAITELNFCPIC